MGKKHREVQMDEEKDMERFHAKIPGRWRCFFSPTLCCDVFVCFCFWIFSTPPPKKKGAAVGGGSLEETFDVERNGALLRVRCIFTIDHS